MLLFLLDCPELKELLQEQPVVEVSPLFYSFCGSNILKDSHTANIDQNWMRSSSCQERKIYWTVSAQLDDMIT